MRLFRFILFVITLCLIALVVWMNITVNSSFDPIKEQQKLVHQLTFLEEEIHNQSLGWEMQQLFPEGFVFVNSLYGLAWCEVARYQNSTIEEKAKAKEEAHFAYKELNSSYALWNFQKELNPAYGVFYLGWKNYLLANMLSSGLTFNNQAQLKRDYIINCESLRQAMDSSNTPYLETYHGSCWPADMSIAVASLAIHDKVYPAKYERTLKTWVSQVKSRLDSKGLVAYKVDRFAGKALQAPGGNAIALMLMVLPDIDFQFSKELYQTFSQHFVETTIGLPSVRQYPKGVSGIGDVDSGPVIAGVGFASTIVSVGVHAQHDQEELAMQQLKTIEAFGLPIHSNEQMKYLLGVLPMGDAFIAWTRGRLLNRADGIIEGKFEHIGFGLFSLLFIVLLLLMTFRIGSKLIQQKAA